MPETLRVQVGIATDPGSRHCNEDFAACLLPEARRPALAAALADGIGGAKGGRVAAETAVRLFLDAQDQLSPLKGIKANAATALTAVNRWLHVQGLTDPTLARMGCTFTALVLASRQMHVVYVGDSRRTACARVPCCG